MIRLSEFRNNPFVRILIPFIAGILIASMNGIRTDVFYPLVFLCLTLTVLFFLNRKQSSEKRNWTYILVSDLFFTLAGIYCCYVYNVRNDPAYFGNYVSDKAQVWVGEVKDLPAEKEKFYKVLAEVRTLNNRQSVSGKVFVYFKKPFDVSLIEPGSIFRAESQFIQPKAPLNPNEFDYKRFLELKNIYFQSFVEPENFELINEQPVFSLVNFGLEIKQKIKTIFETSALNKETAQLCIALLTGYDDEIDAGTINAFAHSGTLHVLSVSGLHTGILYGILIFLLGIIDKHRKYKFLQLVIITISLWCFVLITGFSTPVLRAVIMLNLIAIGRSYYSYSSSHAINILAVSAFLILVFDPLLIYDTGFLLSYSAVLGILCFEPWLRSMADPKNWLAEWIWKMVTVSLAAQITTLPITLFLFHQFPLWFLFSNMIVIPLCGVAMCLGILILLKLSFIAPVLNLCSAFIFYIIHLTDSPHFGYIDNIDFGWRDLIFLSAFIISVSIFLREKKYVYAAGAATLMIIWQLISLFEVIEKKNDAHISVYHISRQTFVDVKNTNVLYFNPGLDASNYNYHIRPNHTVYNYPVLDSLKFDLVISGDAKFLKIGSEDQNALVGFMKPDYLLVTDNAELNESSLLKSIKLVVADGSNKYQNIKKLKTLCDKFAVPFHSTAEKGYVQFDL